MEPVYVVSGASGNTGKVCAMTLLQKYGKKVRVILRSETKAAQWRDLGAEVAIADVKDTAALTAALSGAFALYVMNPPNHAVEDECEEARKNASSFTAAIQATMSLKKVVLLSSIGCQHETGLGVIYTTRIYEDMFAAHLSNVQVSILRAGSFMTNTSGIIPLIQAQKIMPSMYLPLDRPVDHVAVEDIGEVAAELMVDDRVRKVELTGPRLVSALEFAEAWSAELGEQVTAVPVPEDTIPAIMAQSGYSRGATAAFVEMIHNFNSGQIVFEGGPNWEQVKGKVDVRDFVRGVLTGATSTTASSGARV